MYSVNYLKTKRLLPEGVNDQTNRRTILYPDTVPQMIKDIEQMKKQGYTYLLIKKMLNRENDKSE